MDDDLFVVDSGDGPAVVMLHGQPGTHDHLAAVASQLAGRVRIITVDRPGYGRSGGLNPESMAAQAERFAGLIRDRTAAPAIVVGHSFGGGIAILMAARQPDLVAGLILVSSIGGKGSIAGADRVLGLPLLGGPLSAASLAAYGMVAPLLARMRLGSSLLGNVPTTPTTSLLDDRRTFLAEQRTLLAERRVIAEAIESIGCPTTVIQGTLDALVPLEAGRDLVDRIAGARFVELEGVGHLVPRDAPSIIARSVLEMLG
jgi:hypothetical protein